MNVKNYKKFLNEKVNNFKIGDIVKYISDEEHLHSDYYEIVDVKNKMHGIKFKFPVYRITPFSDNYELIDDYSIWIEENELISLSKEEFEEFNMKRNAVKYNI